MQNLRIALGLRLLRPELRALTYDAYHAFEDVTEHNGRHGGYVQGVYGGLRKIRQLHNAFTPAETVERFTRRW